MNLPNLLTMARIFLVPIFLFALLTRVPIGSQIAAVVFVVAAITDGVDGYLARKNKQVTRLGQFLDPLADKLLISAALIALVELKELSTWVALVIIGREMAVTGLRSIAAAEGTIIAAGPWGKAKTVFQIIFVVDAILLRALPETWWLKTLADLLFQPVLWITVALTIWSAIDYLLGYYRGVKQGPKGIKPLRFRLKLPLRRKRT